MADPHLQGLTRRRQELTYTCHKVEPCVHGAFRIILVARGVPKQRKNFVPYRMDDSSAPLGDDGGANALERTDGVAKVLRIQIG